MCQFLKQFPWEKFEKKFLTLKENRPRPNNLLPAPPLGRLLISVFHFAVILNQKGGPLKILLALINFKDFLEFSQCLPRNS